MARESSLLSLWLTGPEPARYPRLEGDIEVDVAVLGGGIAGLTAALALKRRGLTVAVVEGARIGTGVTGNTTGKVTSLHRLVYTQLAEDHGEHAARAYGEANEAALEHIAKTVAAEGIDCGFRRVANYTYAEDEDQLARVRAEAELARRLGLPASFVADVPLPFATRGAVRFDGQAQIHAVQYLRGLARAVDGGGSSVYESSMVTALRDGTPAVAESEHGTVRARDIVVATNVPFGDDSRFGPLLTLHRSYIVASPAAPTVDDTADATFISAEDPLRSILTTRHDGMDYVLVGGEGHPASRGGGSGDSGERFARLAAFSRERLGTGDPAFRWSTQDTLPADGLPFAGPLLPEGRHLYTVTGLRKWGLTNGTAGALVVADLISGVENPWTRLFDSTRTVSRPAAARGDAGTTSAGSPPAPGTLPPGGLPRLAPGQGTVLDLDGQATAVYADDGGSLHALSARCTHLGCTVEFNSGESTWDCPCHGSRFALDGAVIQGPAEKDLPAGSLPGGAGQD